MSFNFPFFLKTKKRIIGDIKPNITAVKIVTIILIVSVSRVKANNANTIIVKDGGTNRMDINRANFFTGLSDSGFKQFRQFV